MNNADYGANTGQNIMTLAKTILIISIIGAIVLLIWSLQVEQDRYSNLSMAHEAMRWSALWLGLSGIIQYWPLKGFGEIVATMQIGRTEMKKQHDEKVIAEHKAQFGEGEK